MLKQILFAAALGFSALSGNAQAQCYTALNQSEFNFYKNTIDQEVSDSKKLAVAQRVLQGRCFTTQQIKTLVQMLISEDNRFALAKAGVHSVVDIENYEQVVNVLINFNNQKTLRQYIIDNPRPQNNGNQAGGNWNPNGLQRPNTNGGNNNNNWNNNNNGNNWNNNGNNGNQQNNICQTAMNSGEFNFYKNLVDQEIVDDKKADAAKKALQGRCFNSQQIKTLVEMMMLPRNQFEVAKAGVHSVVDIENYEQVIDELMIMSDQEALRRYILDNPRPRNNGNNNWNNGNNNWNNGNNGNNNWNNGGFNNGYTGRTGCPQPLSANEFQTISQQVGAEGFDNKKITTLRQALGGRCMSVAQAKQIIETLTFDNNRLDMAKMLFDESRIYDLDNYLQLCGRGAGQSAFQYQSNATALREHLER